MAITLNSQPKITTLSKVLKECMNHLIKQQMLLSQQLITNKVYIPISVLSFCVLLTLMCVWYVWGICACAYVFSVGWTWLPLVQMPTTINEIKIL